MRRPFLVACALALPLIAGPPAPAAADGYAAADAEAALRLSQEAVGRPLGDYAFRAPDGRQYRLSDFRGKPLAVNFIYTSCADICPAITATLADAAEQAWEVFGKDSFRVVTVGFDVANDTPDAMRLFSGRRGYKFRDWLFLSGELPEILGLAQDTGFTFYRSAKGFDHLSQVTLIDSEGVVRAQVYGDNFNIRQFMEPLKAILTGEIGALAGLSGLADRVRLFCTVYDAASGKYKVDYSFYIQIFAGLTVCVSVAIFLMRSWRRARTAPRG